MRSRVVSIADHDAKKISETIIRRLETYEDDAAFGTGFYRVESGTLECVSRARRGKQLITATIHGLKAGVRFVQRPIARWVVYLLDLWLETEERQARQK